MDSIADLIRRDLESLVRANTIYEAMHATLTDPSNVLKIAADGKLDEWRRVVTNLEGAMRCVVLAMELADVGLDEGLRVCEELERQDRALAALAGGS